MSRNFYKLNLDILFLLEKMRFRKFSHLLEVQQTQIPQHFHVASVDLGEIKFVHGEEVKQILSKGE